MIETLYDIEGFEYHCLDCEDTGWVNGLDLETGPYTDVCECLYGQIVMEALEQAFTALATCVTEPVMCEECGNAVDVSGQEECCPTCQEIDRCDIGGEG